jgi:hypothetical protein
VDLVHRALRNTPTTPWAPLNGNNEQFTEDYLARWFEGLAAKENCPKLAAKATLYAEIIVGTHDMNNGADILKCDETFFTQECGMAKSHVVCMKESIIPLTKARTRSPSPPPKGHGTMGDTNQEVLKHPDNRQEALKPPDDTVSFFSGMSVFLEHMANQQTQMTDHLVAQQTHLVAKQTQMTKDARKPVPKPRKLEGTHPTVTGVKAFLKRN